MTSRLPDSPDSTASSKQYGHLIVRKVEEDRALEARKAGSSGLNYSLLSAISIGVNKAYLGLPWGQQIDLTLQEARLLAADTFRIYRDEHTIVISLVTVKGTTKQQERTYYCVTPLWLWDMSGTLSPLHSEVERVKREV